MSAARDLRVSIKGPLTTPVGGGIRSLNVALRQILDLYACVRPVKYYQGVPSPVKHPEKVNIVIFRENTEDVYAGIEFKQGSRGCARLISTSSTTICSRAARRRSAPTRAWASSPSPSSAPSGWCATPSATRSRSGRKTVTLVHKGNIQKFTEGAFREWGYEVATEEFRDQTVTERESWILGNVEAKPGTHDRRKCRAHRAGHGVRLAELPELGLRRSEERARLHRQVARQRRVEVRRSWSTTASPTPSSSRSSFARRTTAILATPTSTATTSPTRRRRRWAAWASRPAPTSATATRSSRPRTAPRPSTPTRTSSIPAR